MEPENKITRRNSVGRLAQLGDLYDARKDDFLKSNLLQHTGNNRDIKIRTKFFDNLNCVENPSEDICDDLKISIACGLVQPRGHARYLTYDRHRKNSVVLFQIYSIVSQIETIIEHPEPKFPLDNEATHFVSGITWGIKSVIVLKHKNIKKEDTHKIEKYLSDQLEILATRVEGKETSTDIPYGNDFSVEIFDDFGEFSGRKNSGESMENVEKYLKSLPHLFHLKNTRKGFPLDYEMTVISDITKLSFSNAELTLYLRKQKEFIDVKRKLDKLVIRNPQTVYMNKLKKCLADIQSELEKMLVEFRKFVLATRNGEKQTESSVTHFFRRNFKESQLIEAVAFESSLKDKKIHFMSENDSLDDVVKDPSNLTYFFVFAIFMRETTPEMWKLSEEHFLKLIDEFKNDDKILLVAVDKYLSTKFTDPSSGFSEQPRTISSPKIMTMQHNVWMDLDVFKTLSFGNSVNLAKSSVKHTEISGENKVRKLTIPCPESLIGACNSIDREWVCLSCKKILKIRVADRQIHCECGQAPCKNFDFKCNDPEHGPSYSPFNRILETSIILEKKTIFVLQTSRKCWSRKFVDYLRGQKPDEEDIELLISNKFTTSYYNVDDNVFMHFSEVTTESDVDSIYNHLISEVDIQGICIFTSTSEPKLDAWFEKHVKEVFTRLHKNAWKNIVFCSTVKNFWESDNREKTFNNILKKYKVDFTLKECNTYCFDDDDIKHCDSEAHRLILHFKSLEPHVISETMLINEMSQFFTTLKSFIMGIHLTEKKKKSHDSDKSSKFPKVKRQCLQLKSESQMAFVGDAAFFDCGCIYELSNVIRLCQHHRSKQYNRVVGRRSKGSKWKYNENENSFLEVLRTWCYLRSFLKQCCLLMNISELVDDITEVIGTNKWDGNDKALKRLFYISQLAKRCWVVPYAVNGDPQEVIRTRLNNLFQISCFGEQLKKAFGKSD